MSSERLIPLAEPDLRGNEESYLRECIQTGWVSSAGPFVGQMEARVAALCESSHAVATASGTTALQLLLATLGIGAGQRVAVPDWTFAATANAVVHAGAMPVMVDVDPDHWSLDADMLSAAFDDAERSGKPIAAVIAVDPLGLPADFDGLIDICRQRGATLIEDAAGALGSHYKGRPAGGLADAGIFSFNGNKIVTGGGGGAIVTNHETWACQARHLSTQARTGSRYAYDAIGFNYRTTNLSAAVVVAQLERLETMVAARRKVADAYTESLDGRGDLAPPPAPNWAEWNGWMYVVRTASPEAAADLVAHLQRQGISARPFWQALSTQPAYADFPRQLRGISESLSGTLVSLPCGSMLAETEVARVVAALASWRGRKLSR
jgi:perosamine synthetase